MNSAVKSSEAKGEGFPVTTDSVDPVTRSFEDLKKLVDEAVSEKFKDKDYVVRDVQHDAFDGLMKIVRNYAYLIGIALALVLTLFAVIGIKTVGSFYALIRPQLEAVQSAIAVGQITLHNQQIASAENENRTTALRSKLDGQQAIVDSVSRKGAGLDAQVIALQKQLDSLKQQTTAVVAQNTESNLESDFPTFSIGTPILTLNGQPYKAPDNLTQKPIVYIVAWDAILQVHDMSDIQRFASGLERLDYMFVHGNFGVRSGRTSSSGSVVPNASCNQVIYFDPIYQSQAAKVADLIAFSFRIDKPTVKLVHITSPVIDQLSKIIIQDSKINVAASVYFPEQSYCANVLSQY